MADSKTKLADKYNLTRDDCGKKGARNLFRFNVRAVRCSILRVVIKSKRNEELVRKQLVLFFLSRV